MLSIHLPSILAHLVRSAGVKVSINEFATHGPDLASNQRLDVVHKHIGDSAKQFANKGVIKTLVPTFDVPLDKNDFGLGIGKHKFFPEANARHIRDGGALAEQSIKLRTAIRLAQIQEFGVDGFHPWEGDLGMGQHVEAVSGVVVAEGLKGGSHRCRTGAWKAEGQDLHWYFSSRR